MHQFRTLRPLRLVAALTSCAALSLFGCKSKSETFQTPGADQHELNREGTNTAHDHASSEDKTWGMPGATPEESANPSHHQAEGDHKSTTLDTPGETKSEAAGKGLLPGIGGGPVDETARPSAKTRPPSTEKSDQDKTWQTPGATEKEVTDEDVKTSPLGTGQQP